MEAIPVSGSAPHFQYRLPDGRVWMEAKKFREEKP